MKKNLLWMLAAIFFCGLTVTTMTSCSNEDDPVRPVPDMPETLIGDWFVTVNRADFIDDSADENDMEYVLLSFDQNGVITQTVYIGNVTKSIRYWERMRRHGIYTVDEVAHTFTSSNVSSEPSTIGYSFDRGAMTLSYYTDEEPAQLLTLTFHRLTKAEEELLAVYDRSLQGDDYVGKWFGVNENNGLYTYTMHDFTEGHGLQTIRYSVYGDKCTRTAYTQHYNNADEDEYDEPTIEIHDPNDYSMSMFYWWRIEDNNLVLGIWEYEDLFSVFHPLTQADLDLMAELDKMSENNE